MSILGCIRCPLCAGSLNREGASLLCGAGHTFDVAKAGYVNLLPPGKGKNARTGDEKTMVKARVDFLSKNYYAKISDGVSALLAETRAGGDYFRFADMGCGEGYHTCRIAEGLFQLIHAPVMALGFDASKFAAEYASKQAKSRGLMASGGVGAPFDSKTQAWFFPANLFHLPLADHSLDGAISMFAPVAGEEAHRVLKKEGKMVVVSSGRNHLVELRKLIYDQVHFSDAPLPTPEGFSLLKRQNLTYETVIERQEDIASLFVMTPFYYKTTEAGRNRLLAQERLPLTVDVNYSVYEVI